MVGGILFGVVVLLLGVARAQETAAGVAEGDRALAFYESVVRCPPFGGRVLNNSWSDAKWLSGTRVRRGVVYAAIGASTLRKASASALSVRAMYPAREVGILAIASDAGLAELRTWFALRGKALWFDLCFSIDGHGLDFDETGDFEAFSPKTSSSSSETSIVRQQPGAKSEAWSAVRRLRTAKIAALSLALVVFEEALFLDADTALCGSLDSAFEALGRGRKQAAFVAAPSTHHSQLLERLYGLKDEIPEPNTGVLAFGASFEPVLKRWLEVYWRESLALSKIQNPMDQPPLRVAMYQLNATFALLPTFLNCRGHAQNLKNFPLPLKCGGITDDKVLDTLSKMMISKKNQRVSPQSLDKALALKGGRHCIVIHSHALPRPKPVPPFFQEQQKQRRPNVLLQMAKKNYSTAAHEEIVAVVEAIASLPESHHKNLIVGGDDVLERLDDVDLAFTRSAILLVDDPPTGLLDALTPFWPEDRTFASAAGARADRLRRLGPPNLADLADVLDRLRQDFTLVLLTSKPKASKLLLRIAFPDRQDLYNLVDGLLLRRQINNNKKKNTSHHAPPQKKNKQNKTIMRLDSELYRACERLFDEQRQTLLAAG